MYYRQEINTYCHCFMQNFPGGPSQCKKIRENGNNYQGSNGKTKLFFTDNMIFYIGKQKDSRDK